MKSQNGITLLSVTIYVLVLAIVIGIIATVSTFFYSNTKQIEGTGKTAAEFDKFNLAFVADTHETKNTVVNPEPTAEQKVVSQISFSNGTTYTYQEKAIYRNKVKICNNVTECSFKIYRENKKTIIEVLLVLEDSFSKTVTYVVQG